MKLINYYGMLHRHCCMGEAVPTNVGAAACQWWGRPLLSCCGAVVIVKLVVGLVTIVLVEEPLSLPLVLNEGHCCCHDGGWVSLSCWRWGC